MKVRDIVLFNKDKCFNGAIQTEWFYDSTKVGAVASSYVFHGPKYFGVSESDVDLSGHRLIDSASFALNLINKLYTDIPENSFVMSIAGYGAGKSHLAVCLAALFSGNTALANTVIDNIRIADASIAKEIQQKTTKNLVIVLNGMNNFNLDSEILRCAKLSLEQNGLSDDILKKLTKSYDVARYFVEHIFDAYVSRFEFHAAQAGMTFTGSRLKGHLLSTIESEANTLSVINQVYREVNGDSIHWERGLSAGDVLSLLSEELCGSEKPFNKVVLLFDEFGRYIEYAAANPTIAGEAALQQIFESVQNASGRILFSAFVQSELDAYLARIEKTSNIMRYVGRYKASENLFLSSNFETILANLLQKSGEGKHSHVLDGALTRYERFHHNMENAISRWDRSAVKKSVWTSWTLYESVILKGCYPLHPITVWMLSNMNNWMQQRSSIAFAAEMVDRISNEEIVGNWLPYVYPINIIDSGIFNEMLNSEEKGLVSSQYCMLYRDIIVKVGDKLQDNEKKVLKGILIANIGRFCFINQDDAFTALKYCCNLKDEEITTALSSLENMHGVIAYDSNANTYDLIAEANGFNEFKRIFARYKQSVKNVSITDCNDTLLREMSMSTDIETSFAQQRKIASTEWRFRRSLMDSSEITANTLLSKVRTLSSNNDGVEARGEIIFAYCAATSENEIARISKICKDLDLDHQPIIIQFLDDADGEILSSLTVKAVLNKFSTSDNERFQKQISAQRKVQDKKIIRAFNVLLQKRMLITATGLVQYTVRLNALCTQRFEELYAKIPPFMFDGFENKSPTAARRYLSNICTKMLDRTLMNVQSYNALSTDEKNRVKATLAVGSPTSWQVFNNQCAFIRPMNPSLKEIFDVVDSRLNDEAPITFHQLFGSFTQMPYGMNINAIALFLFYYIAYQEKQILCYYDTERLQPSHLADKIFKGSKLQPKELLKIRIQRNSQFGRDVVKELCDEILSCSSLEDCITNKKKLETLLAQEGISTENQLLVANARTRIDSAIDIRNDIYGSLKKGQDIVAEASRGFSIPKFVNVFSFIVDARGIIKADLPFVYSPQYKTDVETLKTQVDAILEKSYLSAVGKFTCKITQLSQFKNICSRTSKILKANGYTEYAHAIEARAAEVEDELLAKEKYESSLVDFERELSLLTDIERFGVNDCLVAIEKLNGWLVFFRSANDMPKPMISDRVNRIDSSLLRLNNRIDKIHTDVVAVIESVRGAEDKNELSDVASRIKKLLETGVSNDDQPQLELVLRQINDALKMIEDLPNSIHELRDVLADPLKNIPDCRAVVISEATSIVERIVRRQEEWIKRYILPIETKVSSMSAPDCSNWMNCTKEIPEYIDAEIMTRYSAAATLVEKQLHKNRVDGVYRMFAQLNESEKAEFLKRIMH